MRNAEEDSPAVWFPAIRAGTGADVFTERLCAGLNDRGIRAEITWLPHRAEYLPWMVSVPELPQWANVVHVNTWLHPRFIPEHLPVVATLHHSIHDPMLLPYKGRLRAAYHRWWIAPIERRVLKRAHHVAAVSQFVLDSARQDLCNVPMHVIHNGIDTTCFRPGEFTSESCRPFRLLYVGGWMARKGVDLLAPIMRELGEGFELRYTGGVLAEADKSAMPSNMHDLGLLSNDGVIVAMQQADAFLFPSRSEGFGLVAAEAMACGLPVIATNSASLPEIVEDGVTGLLCPRDDIRAFATAVRMLANDTRLRESMANAARHSVVKHFSVLPMIDAYVRLYVAAHAISA
ncbi:glycosyltransferase family 4 protein [Thermomonas sp. HDW16]|uniref:glycosyltransferase family 4 protein n=1 Tax=Thermomonas sp. HDW16 TaxID=2714945 RepID=UPI0014079D36|nr:glycosyltransferase family 4 protein [Thermomonas sp. HDW16]QIL21430.1 glycosyltransferase family 4 protein [Thermomonas sp. HDW16]